MKNLNESQKDTLGIVALLAMFWLVMGFFTVTQPDYCQTKKAQQIEEKHVQSKVLDAYGELFLKNFERCSK
jgi:hypothetical protein